MNRYKLTYIYRFIPEYNKVEYVEWESDKPKWILSNEWYTIIAELV